MAEHDAAKNNNNDKYIKKILKKKRAHTQPKYLMAEHDAAKVGHLSNVLSA